MYFVRKTNEPEIDALRDFEALSPWYDSKEAALAFQEEKGITQKPRQCPVSGKWCSEWRAGLSGWKIYDQNSMEVVLSKIKEPFGIFYSDRWSNGLEYDIFHNSVFLNLHNAKIISFNDLISY